MAPPAFYKAFTLRAQGLLLVLATDVKISRGGLAYWPVSPHTCVPRALPEVARQQSRVERALRAKFHFADSAGKGHAHICIERDLPGERVAWTKFSHGSHEIGPSLQSKIASQLGVCRHDLLAMVGCTISEERYLEIARPPSFDQS
jgi:hypothetical protein